MIGDEFCPTRDELGLPEEPQQDGKAEQSTHGAFMERHRSHFGNLLSDQLLSDQFSLLADSYALRVLRSWSEQAHVHELHPHPRENHGYQHDGHVEQDPGHKSESWTVREQRLINS